MARTGEEQGKIDVFVFSVVVEWGRGWSAVYPTPRTRSCGLASA